MFFPEYLKLNYWLKEPLPGINSESLQMISRKAKVEVTQSYPTLCDPVDYTVHGTLQARILECVAIPFSRGSSQPRNRIQVSTLQVDSSPAELPGKPSDFPNDFLIKTIKTNCKRITQCSSSILELLFASTHVLPLLRIKN